MRNNILSLRSLETLTGIINGIIDGDLKLKYVVITASRLPADAGTGAARASKLLYEQL